MPPLGQTALVLLVPEVDPVLASVRSEYPRLVRQGLPAHLTVRYPWVPFGDIDGAERGRCASLAASAGPVDVLFSTVQEHPGMLALEPDDPETLAPLSRGAQVRWPALRPYAGKYPDSPAHVTLALGAMSKDQVTEIRAMAAPLLPIRARLDELYLVVFGETGWNVRHRWPLRACSPKPG